MAHDSLDPTAAPEAGARKKGIPLWKSALFSLLSAVAVFLFWLFYPILAPVESLQRYLPERCIAAVETHDPVGFAAGMQEQEVIERFRRLPAWPHLSDAMQEMTGLRIDSNLNQLNLALRSAAGSFFGLRNVKAAIAGPVLTEEGTQELVALLVVDNLGLGLSKAGLLFGGTDTGSLYRYSKLPKLEANAPELYLALAPDSRHVLIASNPRLFNRFRLDNPGPAENFADLARSLQTPRNTSGEPIADATPSVGGAAAGGDIASTILLRIHVRPEVLRLFLPGEASGVEFKADLYWNLLDFGGAGTFSLPDLGASTKTAGGLFLPPENFAGLSLSLAMPQDAPALFNQLLSAAPTRRPARPGAGSAAASMIGADPLEALAVLPPPARTFLSTALLPQMDGRGYLALAAQPNGNVIAGAYWGVKDALAARKAFVGGANAALAEITRIETDLMAQMVLSSVKIEPTTDGALLRLPLLTEQTAPWCAFGNGPAGPFGTLCFGRGEGFAPIGSAAASAKPVAAQGRLVWRHTPGMMTELRTALGAPASEMAGILAVGSPQAAQAAQALPQLRKLVDFLDSAERFDAGFIQYAAPSAALTDSSAKASPSVGRMDWFFSGRLRALAAPVAAVRP